VRKATRNTRQRSTVSDSQIPIDIPIRGSARIAGRTSARNGSQRSRAIPIENIYYLLCYAWDALEEVDVIAVRPEQSLTIMDLYARVLTRGTWHLIARGVDRDYQPHHDAIAGVRGKLDLTSTIKRTTWTAGRTICTFDERSLDVPHNRVIKAALRTLSTFPGLAPSLVADAQALCRRLADVQDIPLNAAAFRTVRVHRNNRLYDILINVCRLINDNPFIDETPGHARFSDFWGTRAEMARLFEQFVFNFYSREQHQYTVRRPIIAWHGVQGSDDDVQMLPIMRTDVVLSSRHCRVIIDTKYYENAFQEYRGTRKIRSTHLYQLVAYLTNFAAANPDRIPLHGMLLYPAVDEDFCKSYTLLGHPLSVRSINLAQPWQQIHRNLLNCLPLE
jgi:5-methylcytosine-specific restriction enzyme subunit McrC